MHPSRILSLPTGMIITLGLGRPVPPAPPTTPPPPPVRPAPVGRDAEDS